MFENNNGLIIGLFKNVVGRKLKNLVCNSDQDTDFLILDDLHKFKTMFVNFEDQQLISYPKEVRQLHVFYVIALLLDNCNTTELKLKREFFITKIYLPNLYGFLSFNLIECKNIFKKVNDGTYDLIKDQSANIIDFFLIFYSIDKAIVKNDILSLFFKGILLEADPLDIPDITEYYSKVFKYLYFSYLKNRTSGLLNHELTPDFLEYDDELLMISRDNIYETGLRVTQTRELCIESDTLDTIKATYNKFKNNIFPNEIQKLYTKLILKKEIQDSKTLLIQSYVDTDELRVIRQNLPLILKILRSIHIKHEEGIDFNPSFVNVDRTYVKNEIHAVIKRELIKKLTEQHADVIANSISINLTNVLVTGIYIDPLTMTSIEFDIHEFLDQFKQLLTMIFKKY